MITKNRIRRDYEPLTVVCVMRCLTPASPIGQVYNGDDGQYEPNRSLSPTTILPDIRANAKDGSWKQERVNSLLTSMVWMVDGVDISTLSEWSGLYTITSSDDNKGAITIKKNIPSGTRCALSFKAEFADTRLGINYQIRSEEVILTTTDKADDNYSLSLDCEGEIRYDQTSDERALYDYQIAHGLTPTKESGFEGSYIREIGLSARKANKVLTDGYTLEIYKLNGTKEETAGDEVIELTATKLTLDLRIIDTADYVIKMKVDGKLVTKAQVSVTRLYPSIYCTPTNGTAILVDDKLRFDKAMVSTDGRVIECPARAVKIVWKTESKTGIVTHNEGETTLFELSGTGIGETEDDGWLDVYTEYELKGKYEIATDSNGEEYSINGEKAIFR
jgi:hypothetical protein